MPSLTTIELIEALHCPYCGSQLEADVRLPHNDGDISYGLIRCDCYLYPVIESIPVLRQNSGPGDTNDVAAQFIDRGEYKAALMHALNPAPATPAQTLRRKLRRIRQQRNPGAVASLKTSLSRYRTPTYADYLYQRYANSSFLSAIPLIHALGARLEAPTGQERTVVALDVGCGIGHASYALTRAVPAISVISADYEFVNLFQARLIVPDCKAICIDAEVPLPFSSKFFDIVLCMDAFHYIRSKAALAHEFERIARTDGIILLPHLHNASSSMNPNPGIPLTQSGYLRLFENVPVRLFRESDVLEKFVKHGLVDVSGRVDGGCGEDHAFSLLGSCSQETWGIVENVDQIVVDNSANLSPNPIYEIDTRKNQVNLTMRWPNKMLEAECADVVRFVPRQLSVEESVWDESLHGGSGEATRALARRFVLVDLPVGYDSNDD